MSNNERPLYKNSSGGFIDPDEITAFAALRYLECGFTVQPLQLGKKELVYNARLFTPQNLQQPDIHALLVREFYNRGIALWMGQVDGYFVTLDFDDPAAYPIWAAANPHLAATATAKTPGGGFHVVLKFKRTTPFSGKSNHYVDIISDGWYIAAWPSVHPNGGIYQWLTAPWAKMIEIGDTYEEWESYKNGLDMSRIAFDTPDYDDLMEYERNYDYD